MENKSIFVLTNSHECYNEVMVFSSKAKCFEELRKVYPDYEFEDVEALMCDLEDNDCYHNIKITEYRLSDIFNDE